jgi:hypothetical protein
MLVFAYNTISMSSKGYCRTLEGLIRLAPPSNHPLHFSHPSSQTILVTHYVDCSSEANNKLDTSAAAKPSDDQHFNPCNGSPLWTMTSPASLSDLPHSLSHTGYRPWPSEEHATFLNSTLVQQQLCLEIAAGSAMRNRPELIEQGSTQVLLPGSLREHGEFCVLEVALQEKDGDLSASTPSLPPASSSVEALKVQRDSDLAASDPSIPSSRHSFAWKVQKVDFHRVARFRDRV